jgi:hypothetical protein
MCPGITQKQFLFKKFFSRNVDLIPDTVLSLCNLPSLKKLILRGCPHISSAFVYVKNMAKKISGERINLIISEKIPEPLQHQEDCSTCPSVKCPDCDVVEKRCQLSLVSFF